MASGYPDEAISDFDHAIELQPDFPQAYSNRGNAYYRAGHIALALRDFYHAGTLGRIALALGIFMLIVFLAIRVASRAIHQRWLASGKTS